MQLRNDLSNILYKDNDHSGNFFLTENGRTGLYIFLKSLELNEGDQIAVQPFTCNSAINPVIWNGLIPIYIDIKRDDLSMDPNKLREALSVKDQKIKAVILQHTFGIPGDIDQIKQVCQENGLILIEDCAHAIGQDKNGQMLGSFGDAAVISFGLEKQLPTKVGGAILVNNNSLIDPVRELYNDLKPVSWLRTFLWLLNPLIRVITRKLGSLGSKLIHILEETSIFEVGFSKKELVGEMPSRYPRKISRPIARIVTEYIDGLGRILDERKNNSKKYKESINNKKLSGHLHTKIISDVGYLKFPFYAGGYEDREALQRYLIDEGIYLSDWYENAVYPAGTVHKRLYYNDGSCQVAEGLCDTIINLPTGDPFDLRSVDLISEYYESGSN